MGLTFTPSIATSPLFCGRCRNLGIPEPTIFEGDDYVLGESDTATTNCCTDCWDRLTEECEEESL